MKEIKATIYLSMLSYFELEELVKGLQREMKNRKDECYHEETETFDNITGDSVTGKTKFCKRCGLDLTESEALNPVEVLLNDL